MKRTMAGLSVAVVLIVAPGWPAVGTASADQIGTTRSEVQALEDQMTVAAGKIRALTLQYEQANTRATALTQQAAADQVELGHLETQLGATRSALRLDAIISYTGGAPDATSSYVHLSGVRDPAVRAEYMQLAAGDITEVVDQYRTQLGEVGTAETSLQLDVKDSRVALVQAGAARQAALADATNVQDQLDNLQGQLTALVEAQAQAQATAAAAAAQAAEAAAHPAPAPPTQGVPVDGGLLSVVKTIVAPVAAPVVSPPAATSGGGGAGGVWLQLRQCESGDNYRADTGNGFYGAYQFSEATWTGLGYQGRPDLEPPAMQDQAAQRLEAMAGWGQWPACAAALGLA